MANDKKVLARIAAALGVPTSEFSEISPQCRSDNSLTNLKSAALLSHVREHLRRLNTEERKIFAAALLEISSAD
ncbi:hypothetical protein [Methylobacterium sp. 37f]|uniref:hypothetical protein n=1 Tax=Methylobacterium sp. 37f TaxID=2817058 RepID=UPI001FFC5336|nr:hypothetical protein [Methylobacterium sp. 37f]MCK2056233.1 hypothetical protein [Methylobacterium sp. 37f]